MEAEFARLVAAGTCSVVSEVVILLSLGGVTGGKDDAHGVIERGKSGLVGKGCSQVEAVDLFQAYAPIASPAAVGLMAIGGRLLDWNLRQLT